MAGLGMDFDPDAVEAGQDFDCIPPGEYVAEIVASDVTTTKAGNGEMLKLQFKVIEGSFEGRVIFDQLCYRHENATAQLIAQQRLKAICDAVGFKGNLQDSEDLHYQPMRIKVGIRKDKTGQYSDQNDIKGVKPLSAAPAAAPSRAPAPSQTRPAHDPRQQTAAPRATAQAGARPWGNRAAPPAKAETSEDVPF
jgi:hypothetical protein